MIDTLSNFHSADQLVRRSDPDLDARLHLERGYCASFAGMNRRKNSRYENRHAPWISALSMRVYLGKKM